MKELKQGEREMCPGGSNENGEAGFAKGCEGCPSQNLCKMRPKGPDPDIKLIKERLSSVKHKLIVVSGKGGVGKSTFATQLAYALSQNSETQVGLLDVDICGPSIPIMTGCVEESIHQSAQGWTPVYCQDNLAVMSVGFLLESADEAVIFRGPKKNGLIRQFLRDVNWDSLDYLIIDTPPGTSDEHLSLISLMKDAQIDGAIVVTTPQNVALADVRKEVSFCEKVGLRIIGVVQNMDGFICPKCSGESVIFAATSGGAEKMCNEKEIPFLGGIPLDPLLAKSCDFGESIFSDSVDSKTKDNLSIIVENVITQLNLN